MSTPAFITGDTGSRICTEGFRVVRHFIVRPSRYGSYSKRYLDIAGLPRDVCISTRMRLPGLHFYAFVYRSGPPIIFPHTPVARVFAS